MASEYGYGGAATAATMNPVAGAAIAGGGELLESLLSRIFGSGDRKRLERFLKSLEGQIGQPVMREGEMATLRHRIFQSMLPDMNKYAEQLSRRGGLDRGAAIGALWDRSYAARSGLDADLMMRIKEMQLSRDAGLRGAVLQGRMALA